MDGPTDPSSTAHATPASDDASAAEPVARRVARNAGVRAGAEIVGKISTLGLIAVLARTEGPAGLGVFLFALAWTELAGTPIEMGFDRQILRIVAADRSALGRVLYNVLLLKLIRAVPVVAVSWILVGLLHDESDTRIAVYLLTFSFFFDTVRSTLVAVFNAVERAELVGKAIVLQRLLSGLLGLGAVLLGYGVDGVAIIYVLAAATAMAYCWRLLIREVGRPPIAFPREDRREINRESLPFAGAEILSAGLARLDTVLLSILASQAVVGLYGASYRLLEATLLVSTALQGAFSAMFTYLSTTTEPSIATVFARSMKVSFVILLPISIALGVLPGQILDAFFGAKFDAGKHALMFLAPTVVVLGNVMLTATLISARLNPRILVRCFFVAFAVNLVSNLSLIPAFGATGAALAMLITETVLCVLMLRISLRAIGAPRLVETAGAAVVGGLVMAGTLLLLQSVLVVALLVGSIVYVGVFCLIERWLAPADLQTMFDLIRGRLRPDSPPRGEASAGTPAK